MKMKSLRVFYSSVKRETVYEIEPSRMKRGKYLVTRNSSFKDQVYMTPCEAEKFIDELKSLGYTQAEL